MKLLPIIFGFLILNASDTFACSVCFFGEPDQPQNVAIRAGIVALLGVLLFIMALFINFFIKFSKRSQNS